MLRQTTLIMFSTVVAGFGLASSAEAALFRLDFSGTTDFGLGNDCSFLSQVCALDGQGEISGQIVFDSEAPTANPSLFNVEWNGLVNSFGLVQPSPADISVSFAEETVDSFFFDPEQNFVGVSASIPGPTPEGFSGYNLFLQFLEPTQPQVLGALFQLETPLPGGGTRGLSQGLVSYQINEISSKDIPEPLTILASITALATGLLIRKGYLE